MSADQIADVFGTMASAGVLAILGLIVPRLVSPIGFNRVRAALNGSGRSPRSTPAAAIR